VNIVLTDDEKQVIEYTRGCINDAIDLIIYFLSKTKPIEASYELDRILEYIGILRRIIEAVKVRVKRAKIEEGREDG